MQPDYARRQEALRELCRRSALQAVAIVPGSNFRYFTGVDIWLSKRPTIALVTPDGLAMIVPQLEAGKLDERPDLAVRAFPWSDTDGYMGAFQAAVDALGLRGGALGVDGLTMRVTELLAFQASDPTLKVRPVEQEIMLVRARKEPAEVEAMRRAIAVSERALEETLPHIRPGMTEREIARRLTDAMLALGGEELAFDTHVQTGPNSANPHGGTTDRRLRDGEFMVIDYGCRVDGYPADITRTFCAGEPSEEMVRIYDAVLRANEAGRAAAGPGVVMGDVDRAARAVIEAAGYGEYFIHRTGHGLGLDIHELPQIAAGVTERLEPGMVFTVEPGIYIPGMGGVRIEDNVLVTDAGAETLTRLPRTLALHMA